MFEFEKATSSFAEQFYEEGSENWWEEQKLDSTKLGAEQASLKEEL